jgi:hypothetical protein
MRVVNRHRFPRNWNIATETERRKTVSGGKKSALVFLRVFVSSWLALSNQYH